MSSFINFQVFSVMHLTESRIVSDQTVQMLVRTVLVTMAIERVPGRSLSRRSPLSLRWSVCWNSPGSAGSVT